MTEQKKEYIIDALSEIEDVYIAEAAEYQKPGHTWKYWREFVTVAACVATVVVTAAAWQYLPIGRNVALENATGAEKEAVTGNMAVPESALDQSGTEMIAESAAATEGVEVEGVQSVEKLEELESDKNGVRLEGAEKETAQAEDTGIIEGIGGGVNDALYSRNIVWEVVYDSREDKSNQAVSKVEQAIGQQESQIEAGWKETENPTSKESTSITEWRSAEEIFAEGRDIFLGKVKEKYIFRITEGMSAYFTVLTVEVEDGIRGRLSAGEECTIYLPVAAGENIIQDSSISEDLTMLEVGSRAVFMPKTASEESGKGKDSVWLCYADFADYYFSEGMRYLFLETEVGVSYAEDVYDISGEGAVTLERVVKYIREMISE